MFGRVVMEENKVNVSNFGEAKVAHFLKYNEKYLLFSYDSCNFA